MNPAMPWFYISFADAGLPEGTQFLGGCYVEAFNEAHAVIVAGLNKCNPGGEAMIVEVPAMFLEEHVLPEDRYRLLAREELDR